MKTASVAVIGCSLGGYTALRTILAALPARLAIPVAIAQHRGRDAGDDLAKRLQPSTSITIRDADDKEVLVPGCIYLAPPDYHLLIDGNELALSTDPPVFHARPSIDVLFTSAADSFGPRAIGVVLTGASRDGAAGLAHLVARGGRGIVQDPLTAESAIMPSAALERTPHARVMDLAAIAAMLAAAT